MLRTLLLTLFSILSLPALAYPCEDGADSACYQGFSPAGSVRQLNYYAAPSDSGTPTEAIIAVHGIGHDADYTFNSTLKAAHQAKRSVLVIAPLFQVTNDRAPRCRGAQLPASDSDDLLWDCHSWFEGAPSSGGITSFAAMDGLVREVHARWPAIERLTIAGFSAGGQFVQRYIGFSAAPPDGLDVRYVVADPGSWLYFDPLRPRPRIAGQYVDWERCAGSAECEIAFARTDDASCVRTARWKYGVGHAPAWLTAIRSIADARALYARADVHYLAGALDQGQGRGSAYGVLDRSCAAMAQGPYRYQRAQAYARYHLTELSPASGHPLVSVPHCGHNVGCLFPAREARTVLFGNRD